MKKSRVMRWVLALLPLALAAVLYPRLPDQIVRQWQPTGIAYMPRIYIFLLAVLSPVMLLLLEIVPKIDPKRKSYEQFSGAYQGLILVVLLFFLGINLLVIVESIAPGTMAVPAVLYCAFGLLLAFTGNIMPKFKRNYFIGLRTPWTLADTDVWFKANRLSGYLLFYGGLLIAVVTPFLPGDAWPLVVVLTVAAAIALVPAVMSYIWYKSREKP